MCHGFLHVIFLAIVSSFDVLCQGMEASAIIMRTVALSESFGGYSTWFFHVMIT